MDEHGWLAELVGVRVTGRAGLQGVAAVSIAGLVAVAEHEPSVRAAVSAL